MPKNKIPLKEKKLFFAGNKIAVPVLLTYAMFLVIEVATGLDIHSVTLVANGGLNLITISILVSSVWSFRLVIMQSEEKKHMRQYRILSLIIILLNAITILFTMGIAIFRLMNEEFEPEPDLPLTMAILGFSGSLFNAITLFIFRKEKENFYSIQNSWVYMRNNFFFFAGLILLAAIL
ncbi:MAG TPA: hypothetical protein VJY62_18315, partial [Bacteroidia bacterium]|nr:hypothetical protein [Bacteroidia bacterium]